MVFADAAPTEDAAVTTLGADGRARLRTIVARIERLEEDKQAVQNDLKDVYAEAKGEGFDVKALRKAISLRKKNRKEREEEEAMLELYLEALGDL